MKASQYEPYFRDKDITVMGIGLLGRGVGDIKFLAECGANLIATDLRSKTTLKPSLKELKKYKNISYTLDKHRVGDFRDRDMVIHAAGIKKDNKYLMAAKEDTVPRFMSFGLVMDILKKEGVNVTLIGVTGTKGKSTTTGLIASLLEEAGLKFHLGGNIRGIANLPLLKKVQDGDIILAELDSWQLQTLHDVKQSPNIAVFTNFFEDHMNYYEGSMKHYFSDKAAIFKYQTKDDDLVLSFNANQAIATYYKGNVKSKKHFGRFSELPKAWDYTIFGTHNEQNLSLVYKVGKLLKIPHMTIKKALTEFRGVDGRFQYLGTSSKRDLVFYNDNNSTTPGSTIFSLSSIKKRYPDRDIVLIGGGADKGFHYEKLARYIAKNVSYAFLFPGKGTEKICKVFPTNFKKFTKVLSMRTAFNLALRQAEDGSIIILSPAAASFGLFNNEYERNDQYVERVKRYLRQS
jgi:UDP-N-acetylmuramoylalanine--D-glutamate ligase